MPANGGTLSLFRRTNGGTVCQLKGGNAFGASQSFDVSRKELLNQGDGINKR
jgi:hypothetical protein